MLPLFDHYCTRSNRFDFAPARRRRKRRGGFRPDYSCLRRRPERASFFFFELSLPILSFLSIISFQPLFVSLLPRFSLPLPQHILLFHIGCGGEEARRGKNYMSESEESFSIFYFPRCVFSLWFFSSPSSSLSPTFLSSSNFSSVPSSYHLSL